MGEDFFARLKQDGRRPVALITGASAGLGALYAERLAQRGCDVVLTARREEKLTALAARLEQAHQVRALTLALDLAEPGAAQRLRDGVTEAGWQVDLLVNNAGFGHYGPFLEQPVAEVARMCQLNVTALTELTHLFLPDLLARKRGAVLQIASTAGYGPVPLFAVYAASKAYVLSFAEALAAEYEPQGLRVLCVCPGATATEFHSVAAGRGAKVSEVIRSSPEAVVDGSLKALSGDAWVYLPSFKHWLQSRLMAFTPVKTMARVGMEKVQARLTALRDAP